jgi:Family of unknown function (DUF6527)
MADLTRIAWWQWIPIFRWRIVAVVDEADLIPLRLPRNGAVLVGTRNRPKWIAFDCPCRDGHRIMLSTDHNARRHWATTVQGSLTISPSIDYAASTDRCHYFIRAGRVRWVEREIRTAARHDK